MKTPKVSVLVITYNYAHFLEACIESVLNQTFTDFELIISDNNSTDNTAEIVQKYLQDERVIYHKNAINVGVAGNWNTCLKLAKGEYLKFLCADDKFDKFLLEKFISITEKHPDVALVTCFKEAFGDTTGLITMPLKNWHSGQEIINYTLNTYGWLGEPSVVMIKRKNLHLGGFREDVIWLIDWEMWLRQLTAGNCYIIPEPLVWIRIHHSQVTTNVMKNFINYFEEYHFYKAIQNGDGYTINTSGIDMEKAVKMRAAKCAKAMYKVMPFLYKKHKRDIFKRAYKIADKEHVLLYPLKKIALSIFKKSEKK